MAVIRNSKQRDAIKQFLKTTDTHPTAEAVYENIKTLLGYKSQNVKNLIKEMY